MNLINTTTSLRTVYKDGVKTFVPVRKTTICGIGWWRIPKDWEAIQKRLKEDRDLGLDSESTLTHIKVFNEKIDPDLSNPYYND